MIASNKMPWIVALIAVLLVVAAVLLGSRLLNGDDSLLRHASIRDDAITPNADGDSDVTIIEYQLSRNADVSIYFENSVGERFYFREDKPRGVGEYRVAFSGIVDGYQLPDDGVEGQILTRLLQDGSYTWTIVATDEEGVVEQAQGTLDIADADTTLPDLRTFSLTNPIFTPNRDGISDRVQAQFFLAKAVDDVRVFLLMPDGKEIPISEYEQAVPAGSAGWHTYDYEGGVDNGATPPADGTYPVIAIARDLEGQTMRVEEELSIQYGGVPRAQIFAPPAGDTVAWDVSAVALCDTITFTLTVENYGTTPIRTSGPAPGTTYDSDWNYNTIGWHTESGVFRIGIGFENELSNYPYRWAIGNDADLVEIDGYKYLMPGERAQVTGSIRVTDVFGARNPQPLWAGLIHEDVEISQFNSRVDPISMLVDAPDAANMPECEPREIPVRRTNGDG